MSGGGGGSSWEIQEDRFDDIEDSEMDDRLSNYEDDLYIDEHVSEECQKLNEDVIEDYVPPRLSTIVEESNVTVEGNEAVAQGDTYSVSESGSRGEPTGDDVTLTEGSSQFGSDGVRRLQHDPVSFFRYNLLAEDDNRFGKACLEKENSWEPSIHHSPPPTPKINLEELAALNMTGSTLIRSTSLSSASVTPKASRRMTDVENTPPTSSPFSQYLIKRTELGDSCSGPKMSTPKSTDGSLRNLSLNCISSIHPETVSPKSVRGIPPKSGGVYGHRMSKVEEEPSLSSSAIDRVLKTENFEDADELVAALLKAKTRPRLKLEFPEVITGEKPEIKETTKESSDSLNKDKKDAAANEHISAQKVVTKHDRSGITNKIKKRKTVQQRNSLREGSQTPENISKTTGSSEKLTSHGEWRASNTATVSPFPSGSIRQADAESQGKFLSCDQSFVYFGFVDVKCRVNRTVRLRNISSKSLNLKLHLHSMDKGYELLEQGIIVLKPEETHLVHIVFQPPFGACFQNILHIKVMNGEHINYSVRMLGSGGVAALRVLSQSGLNMLRDGSFVLTTQGLTNISFSIENKGLRDAFVRIIVLDKETKRALSGYNVIPSECVSILHRTKQKFNIEVPSFGLEGSSGDPYRSFPASSFSMQSLAGTGSAQYYVQLLWGEEAQRRRLKRYESEKLANYTFNGYTFTKCAFLNEEKCKWTASEDASYGFYDRDAFELGLKITLISVVDNRMSLMSRNSHLLQEQMLCESVILEPNATLSPAGGNKSVVEDVSNVFTASRVL